MNEIIKNKCFYQFSSGIISEEMDFPEPTCFAQLSKLNIFCNDSQTQQTEWLFDLLNHCNSDLKVYFQFNQQNNYWTIIANYSELTELLLLLNETKFDYLLWPENVFTPPQLMLFDMDSTFIEIEVIDELAKLHQVGSKVSKITESAMRGELDFAESLIARVACLKGLSSNAIEKIANNLPLSRGVVCLVEAARHNECATAIVSGGFSPFVELLKDKLNLFKVKANHLEVISDQLSGKLLGEIVDAQAKAKFLEELCRELKISPNQVIAIGDGANDLLMMQAAGFNLAYYAKPKVQQQAKGRMNQSTLDRLIHLFEW